MTRTIAIIGGKGGVGKTTLTSNLAYALTEMGEDVIAIDTNLTTPNLGLHIGMHLAPKTLHDVLRGRISLNEAIYPHPFGFKFIPASLSVDDLSGADPSKLNEVTFNLTGKADYVLMDCAAGLGREAVCAMDAADEILLVTNADMPSVVDALKAVDIARRMDKKVLGVVVNRRSGKRHEMDAGKIMDMLGTPVISEIPEDVLVSESIAARQPVLEYAPESDASFEIRKLAYELAGRKFFHEKHRKSIRSMIFSRLSSLIGR